MNTFEFPRRVLALVALLLAAMIGQAQAASADEFNTPFQADAAKFREQLQKQIMPYWYDTTIDKENGGYALADDGRGPGQAKEKQLVSQTRLIWTYCHLYRKGFRDPQRDYLKAAAHGYQFLMDHFLDKEHGGFFWKTDMTGKVLNPRKILYGESFAVYALVEYYRASGDKAILTQALELYRLLQRRAHDEKNSGWIEHFRADWTPILQPDPECEVEVAGYKSANAHLHWMEALTELYDATREAEVRKSLEECVRINATYFYPMDPGRSSFHRQLNWQPVTDLKSAGLSYGHNVEFAWLLIHAQEVLGVKKSWKQFNAHLHHALKYGYDHQRGGLYSRGMDDQPAKEREKIWWVQAEMLAALTDAIRHQPKPPLEKALRQEIDFIRTYQSDPKDGVWRDTVMEDGQPKTPAKAHNWKANYHDVRAMVKFVEAFEK